MKVEAKKESDLKKCKQDHHKEFEKNDGEMKQVVNEKKRIADMASAMENCSTLEGAEKVRGFVMEASKAMAKEFEQKNIELEQEFNKTKESEDDLKQRTDNSKKDTHEIQKAKSQIKETQTAVNPLNQAEQIAKDNASFTQGELNTLAKDHQRSIVRRNRQQNEFRNINISL